MKNLLNKKFCLLGIVVFLLHYSCTEPLELAPISSIGANSFWQSEQDATGGVIGMYNQFRNMASRSLYYMGEARSEVMSFGLQNADFRIKYFENDMNEGNADLDWLQAYRIINYANLVIRNVPDISFPDEDKKNDLLAQAYSMRAFLYFVLAKTWGDVPLVTEPVEGYDAQTTFQERVAVSAVFDLIKSDLNEAINLFPNNEFPAGRAMWSKPAANTLKGDVYLWTGKTMGGGEADITTALSALNEAKSANLGLLDDYSRIFDFDNKGNQEIIFAVHFSDFESSNNMYSDMYINALDIRDTYDQQTLETIGTPGGFNWWAPSATIRNQFTEDDSRKSASFLEVFSNEEENTFITSIVLKGKGYSEGGTRRFLDDIVIYRYAELLLLIAEAKTALGQDPSTEINMVRSRAYGENFAMYEFANGSQQENDEAILQERLFELAFEGKRWWDLIRFDQAFDKVPSLQDRVGQNYLMLWPITLETISLNSKITQNPGYEQ
ncbi:RagB/SusD family nutrient uptake outer membrane protein [Cyclobacterium jeungdonense]|uniref:RagB/SusD family nutrient uptake outer membrane protein n=1 Tax=Cyclobacterium jeungdonense TaxID=708087 RepID=A0ABT8C2Q7_9BACT|nr:RagB/SusD family nutrient uptake outer membrane protein [Cyclobacterium jeungdonense]MDN3687064.1 RagB/SusD family nutrient uptake outer membrane protein [Cyclobacterium jeungdonense]